MSGRWVLEPLILGQVAIEITQDEYEELQAARALLKSAVAFEERFSILVDNLVDYERELFDVAFRQAVRPFKSHADLHLSRVALSRRFLNLLASCRAYVDHLHSDLDRFAPGDAGEAIRTEMHSQYDGRRGYRAMEAVRNIVQHRDLSLNAITFPHKNIERRLRVSVIPRLVIDALERAECKPAITEELKTALGAMPELTPLVRDYMEGLGSVHRKGRQVTADRIGFAAAVFRTAIARVEAQNGQQPGIVAGWQEDGSLTRDFQVFNGLSVYWQLLTERTTTLKGIKRLYFSGEAALQDEDHGPT